MLDEAHAIKDRTSSTARACFALEARARWCLSGTPLQNSVDDLFAYFRFLVGADSLIALESELFDWL